MGLPLLLIIIGIVLAILVSPHVLGVVVIIIGLVLLIWPRIAAGRGRV
jgi:hypothetical protein